MPDDNDIRNNPEGFREHARQQAMAKPIAYEDFYYLLGRYPYLELSHIEATHYPTTPPRIVQSSALWNMHVYDQMIISSQSELLTLLLTGIDLSDAGIETQLFKDHQALKRQLRAQVKAAAGESVATGDDDDSGSTGIGELKPVGTIINQFFNTALEMVGIACAANWPGIRIIRGYYPMQRAAWIACENQGLRCEGFEPTPEDHVVYSWVKSHAPHAFERITKRPGAARR